MPVLFAFIACSQYYLHIVAYAIICEKIHLKKKINEDHVNKLQYQKKNIFQKSDNLQHNTLVRWDKWLVNQASDVPSIIFLWFLIDLGHSKLFIFIFVNL